MIRGSRILKYGKHIGGFGGTKRLLSYGRPQISIKIMRQPYRALWICRLGNSGC